MIFPNLKQKNYQNCMFLIARIFYLNRLIVLEFWSLNCSMDNNQNFEKLYYLLTELYIEIQLNDLTLEPKIIPNQHEKYNKIYNIIKQFSYNWQFV